MGMFEQVAKLVNAAGNGLPGDTALLGGVVKMLGTDGSGLAAIIEGFQQAGLGSTVASWVGTGANLPVSPGQILKGLGPDRVRELAQSSGL
ncbi:MAG: YidB family protein, partial [Acidobacteriota bacterium]|nr:YidB family protein [Acidobacteriota bacterium]